MSPVSRFASSRIRLCAFHPVAAVRSGCLGRSIQPAGVDHPREVPPQSCRWSRCWRCSWNTDAPASLRPALLSYQCAMVSPALSPILWKRSSDFLQNSSSGEPPVAWKRSTAWSRHGTPVPALLSKLLSLLDNPRERSPVCSDFITRSPGRSRTFPHSCVRQQRCLRIQTFSVTRTGRQKNRSACVKSHSGRDIISVKLGLFPHVGQQEWVLAFKPYPFLLSPSVDWLPRSCSHAAVTGTQGSIFLPPLHRTLVCVTLRGCFTFNMAACTL